MKTYVSFLGFVYFISDICFYKFFYIPSENLNNKPKIYRPCLNPQLRNLYAFQKLYNFSAYTFSKSTRVSAFSKSTYVREISILSQNLQIFSKYTYFLKIYKLSLKSTNFIEIYILSKKIYILSKNLHTFAKYMSYKKSIYFPLFQNEVEIIDLYALQKNLYTFSKDLHTFSKSIHTFSKSIYFPKIYILSKNLHTFSKYMPYKNNLYTFPKSIYFPLLQNEAEIINLYTLPKIYVLSQKIYILSQNLHTF